MQTIDSQMLDLALIQKVLILNFIDDFLNINMLQHKNNFLNYTW